MRCWVVMTMLVVMLVAGFLWTEDAWGRGGGAPSGQNVTPSTAEIQQSPNNFPYPTMPWAGASRPEVYGQVVGYREMPPQQVTVELPATGAETAPFRLQPQVVTIPGYIVTETTNGYLYPERWTVEQLNVGVYQLRLLPPEYIHK